MSRWLRLGMWLHRRLARAFPHEFQVVFGNDLEQMGDDAAPYIWKRYGIWGLTRFVASVAAGLAVEYGSEFRQDVRYAVRRLRESPGFTAMAVLSLALSIGMSSLFLLQMADMTRTAPEVRDPHALVAPENLVAYPYFEAYGDQDELFTASAAFLGPTPFNVGFGSNEAKSERVFGHLVTLDYFSTLGVTPAAGRFFDSNVDGPGARPTVVVTHRFWRTRLDARTDVIGSTLRVNGRELTVIGVGPGQFEGAFPRSPAELFVPLSVGSAVVPELRGDLLRDPEATLFRALFRLADDVATSQVEAALQVVTKNLDEQKPESERPREETPITLMDAGIGMPLPRQMRKLLWGVNGFVMTLILGIACAHLAVLLLARGDERRKEIAIRLSVGASRFRLMRQLLTESLVLSVAGGVAGLALVRWLIYVTSTMQLSSGMAPPPPADHFDGTTVLVVLSVAMLAGLAFGLVPALSSTRGELPGALKEGARDRLGGYRKFGLRNQLIVFQAAGSLMLLLITGFVVVGYQQVYRVDPGFDTEDLYLLALDPARDGYSTQESGQLLERLPEQLGQRPEIVSAALSFDFPFSQPLVNRSHRVSVLDDSGENVINTVARQRIGEGYFSVLGVPLVRGREFAARDRVVGDNRETPAVLNQAAAQLLFAGDDPLGQAVRAEDQSYIVVGIVTDLRSGLMMATPAPTIFVSVTPEDLSGSSVGGATVILRSLAGASAAEVTTTEIAAFDPELSVFNLRKFDHDSDQFNEMMRLSSFVNGGVGVFGTILSVIGLFAVTLHAVARRRKEVGIRVALGARRDQVMRLVLKEGLVLVVVGGTIGFAGAYSMARAFSSAVSRVGELFAVGADDPFFVVGVPLVWAAVALFACYLPARRAMSIDPAATLKAE